MTDKAHLRTESLLTALEFRLRRLYRKTNKQLQEDLEPLISAVVLDGENTQKQRLQHAERNGKDEAIKIVVDALLSANQQTVNMINQNQAEIYRINLHYAADDIIRQIKDSMDGG